MSIFNVDDNTKEAIRFFNQLSDREKVTIVSDLSSDTVDRKLSLSYKPIIPLLKKNSSKYI
jgi:hypothetical protein